jgi:methylase of polypeptide subunit release factors
MIKANDENDVRGNSKAEIVTANFLNVSLKHPKVDMIITSPPYVTSYEYADLHQLPSLWLGYAEDYRELREGSIGSLHHVYNFDRELKRLNETGSSIVFRLLDHDKPKARSVAKYFLDMQKVAKACHAMLSERGMSLFIIGNTEYKGIRIENERHLSESLFQSGFAEVIVTKRKITGKILTPYRDELGRFTTDDNSRRVYGEEFIVIGRK